VSRRSVKRLALRVAAVAVAGSAIAAAFAFGDFSEDTEPDAVPTAVVTRTEFRRETPAEGTLKAVDSTPITAPQNAQMPLKVAWLVSDGERVKAGDTVVRFDPTDMEELLRTGRESVEQAGTRMAKERAESRSNEHRRDREAAMAERQVKAAREFDLVDEQIFSRHEIIKSQIDVELAGARMEYARRVKDIERSASTGKLDVLSVHKRQAQMLVDRAEGGLAKISLIAPASGVLLLRRDWRGKVTGVGDTIWPGQPLAEVAADASMEAEVFVLEADGGALTEGQAATVVVESAPGRTFAGKLKRVAKLAKPRDPKVPVQYFAVTISLERTHPEVMKIGNRVRATIVEEASEALAIPRQAVFTRDGVDFVYRATAGGFERAPVTLGPATPGRVVVTEGLDDGDAIALREPDAANIDSDASVHER
jgi:multidrug efflux pump subunit AcrA (membrane-fusion protein)